MKHPIPLIYVCYKLIVEIFAWDINRKNWAHPLKYTSDFTSSTIINTTFLFVIMLAHSTFSQCMFKKHNMLNLSRLTFLRRTKIQLVVYSIIIAARNDVMLHLVAVCAHALLYQPPQSSQKIIQISRSLFFLWLYVWCVSPIRTALLVLNVLGNSIKPEVYVILRIKQLR